MEVFPTCIRQSGIGFATLISQTISIGGPYVIFLGATDLKLPYLIMFLICVSGAVATAFLPETLNRQLPETLAEASAFGSGDSFFSFRPGGYGKVNKANNSVDWNEIMKDAFGGKEVSADDGVSPELIKHLLVKHYSEAGESKI